MCYYYQKENIGLLLLQYYSQTNPSSRSHTQHLKPRLHEDMATWILGARASRNAMKALTSSRNRRSDIGLGGPNYEIIRPIVAMDFSEFKNVIKCPNGLGKDHRTKSCQVEPKILNGIKWM